GITWEDQGYRDYDGIAWYRKDVTISRDLTFDSLYLTFGGVDDEYDLFLNGRKVAHHGSAGSSVWSSATSTEISSLVTPGEKILIALRVNDWGGGGGLTLTPVVIADVLPPRGIRFNLADKTQAELYMNVLHRPLIDQGVKFWWVDGGSGSCEMEGLNSQMWTNKVFYDFTQQQTGKRSFIFSRSGGWGSHRYPSLFTGDTYSQWEVLAFEIPYTSQGGNVLMPYITHDIGGFIGPNISPDLYVRWVQFGALSPFLRLHSAHENPGEGNRRMPWVFGSRAEVIARSFFQLRYRLIPYIYTYCRLTHDEAMPLVRPLYLEYPSLEQAYRHPEEYFFGKELLVSPVVDSLGEKEIYLPPGAWIDYFSGQALTGDQTIRRSYPLDAFPMFVRSGSIIPMERERDFSDQRPLDTLTIDVYGSPSRFNLYEDDGTSLEYLKGKYAWTPITSSQPGKRATQITIGPTKGNFSGQVTTRSYEVRLHSVPQPRNVTINNRKVNEIREEGQGWRWDSSTSTVSIFVDKTGIGKQINIGVK
ncbi:MAG TPA: TIM-barrel domain-containing protein, partial [Bacteroidota bacterium]|nr:TIM-barrel domain-containing protein [Bacteroidota bacterium]